MSKSAKKWFLAAAFLVLIGAVLFAAVMTVYHWDFSRLSTDRFETNTCEISEAFSDIKLNTETADILFAASSDGVCRVVCYEPENRKHSVRVLDGTLTVSAADDRAWYEHIGVSFHSPQVTVYLPGSEYASIVIDAGTGDIEIAEEFKIGLVDISLSTGEIRINHMAADTLTLSSSTGDIVVSDVTCTGDVKASVTTGEVKMTDVTCRNLVATGSTSDISLQNVIAAGKLSIERSTGNVTFDGSDAAEIFVKTSTGDVTGSFLTDKVFVTETSTGYIAVPRTASGGKCEIITSTGDIVFH